MDAATRDLLDFAWSVIANAGGGDWTKETNDWQEAAAKWRDRYHRPALEERSSLAVVGKGGGQSTVLEALEAAEGALLTAQNTIECQSLHPAGHPRAGEPLVWHQKATEALKQIIEVRAMAGAAEGPPWNPRPATLAEARACPTCFRPPVGFEFIGDALQRDRETPKTKGAGPGGCDLDPSDPRNAKPPESCQYDGGTTYGLHLNGDPCQKCKRPAKEHEPAIVEAWVESQRPMGPMRHA